MSLSPIVIIGYGNPSRGDDALGPLVIEQLEQQQRVDKRDSAYELITDFQLQIEHVTDLENRDLLLFIDAAVSTAPPYQFSQLKPLRDHSYSSHSLTPATLLAVFEDVYKKPAPPAYLLTIPGVQFELGKSLSPQAKACLGYSLDFINALLEKPVPASWDEKRTG